jgi:hypothetical protein
VPPHERDPGHEGQLPAEPARPSRAAAATPLQPALARMLALQQSAGNQAVAAMVARWGIPVVAPPDPHAGPVETHSVADVRAMTLDAFHTWTREQADWRQTPDMVADATARDELRELLEWATGGATRATASDPPVVHALGSFVVSDLLAHFSADEQRKLRAYADAQSQHRPTIEVSTVTSLDTAIAWGDAILQLEAVIPLPRLREFIKQEADRADLEHLIAGTGERGGPGTNQVAPFCDFVTRANPLLQATNGAEVDAFNGVAKVRPPADYIGNVPHVRNLHHFEAAALDALQDAWTNGNVSLKPFTLILHSGLDHNGAFHHDANLTAAITEDSNFTLMVEGARTLAEIGGLVPDLATRFGVGGRIQQAMIAGHGESRSIDLAADENARGEIREDSLDLDHNGRATERLFRTLLDNMDSGPNARILLNACLTASHEPLERIPASERGAAAAIRRQAQDPSIADRLRDMARARGFGADTVSAATGSFTADATLVDPVTGELRLGAPGYDPQLTAPDHLDYLREAGEPEGAMRAVLEVWGLAEHGTLPAIAPAAGGAPAHTMAELRTAMETRVAAGGASWADHLIVALYTEVLNDFHNGALINQLTQVNVVRTLAELEHEETTTVSAVYQVPQARADRIYTELSHAADWTSRANLRLVVLHSWAAAVPARRVDLLEVLGGFTCQEATDFVDWLALDTWALTAPLLDPATATTATARDGQLRLALMDAVRRGEAMDANALATLRTLRGPDKEAWAAGVEATVDAALGRFTTTARILETIREPDPAPVGGGGGGGGGGGVGGGGRVEHDYNVDLDRDDENDIYVEPMPRTGAVTASLLNVRERPGMRFAVLTTIPRDTEVILIGRVGRWYAIEHDNTTAFVHSSWVRLRPNP